MMWSLLLQVYLWINKRLFAVMLHNDARGESKSLDIQKICFNIGPLTFLDFFRFLFPSETTGSSVSTKSKSQISMCGSIVPTATKLPVYKKW